MEAAHETRWLVILNPHAGSGRGAKDKEKIEKKLHKASFDFRVVVSEYPKHAVDLTIQAITEGYRNLIVAGGDGSLNEVVNGIFGQSVCQPEEITVGMIPVGTGNDWIKTFGIPNSYKEAIKIIKKGETIRQDIGRINYSLNGEPQSCYFANMAGFGFDAMVAEKTNVLKNKGRTGIILYMQALISSFWQYQTTRVKVSYDDKVINELIFSVSLGIGKFNGGGMMQAPGARPTSGTFHITIIRKIGIFGILRNISRLYSGEFTKDYRVSTFRASQVSVSSAKNISGEADGESLGDNKFEVALLSQKLSVIYNPENYLE
jgi:YegS/Rv2252/BmrU family lipid kinase